MFVEIANEDNDEADDDDSFYEDSDDDADDEDKDSQASCGGGVQRREATCVRADGRALHPAQCAHAPMPTLVQPCEVSVRIVEYSTWQRLLERYEAIEEDSLSVNCDTSDKKIRI